MRSSRWKVLIVVVSGLGAATALAADQPPAAKPRLKTSTDRASYLIGRNVAMQFHKQLDVNYEALIQGIRDVGSGAPSLVDEKDAEAVFEQFQQESAAKQQQIGENNKKDGAAFLIANAKKPNVKVLPSGLEYKVLVEGKGRKPTPNDTVKAHYRGTFIDGTEFDSSFKGPPLTFSLPENNVIQGWKEALLLMPAGSKWQLVVPSNLAYGERGRPGIPPNATLIFEVELVEVIAPNRDELPPLTTQPARPAAPRNSAGGQR